MPNTIRILRGDDKTLALTVKDALGNAVDLRDALIWLTVKRAMNIEDSMAAFTRATNGAEGGADNQILITDAPKGKAEIYVVPSNTQNMKVGINYVADVQVKLGTKKVYTVWVGTFVLDGDVTRRNA